MDRPFLQFTGWLDRPILQGTVCGICPHRAGTCQKYPIKNVQNIKIERIVSYGQTTPEDKPYIQTQDELVFVLQGQATLLIKQSKLRLRLKLTSFPRIIVLLECPQLLFAVSVNYS